LSGGWNPITQQLREDLNRLQKEIVDLIFIPRMRNEIVAFLGSHRDATKHAAFKALVPHGENVLWLSFYHAWEELENDKFLLGISQGQGKPRLWRLAK
jgi:hypothetical protein